MQRPLSDMESWKLARERSDRKEGESQYYGNTEQHLESYTQNYQKCIRMFPFLRSPSLRSTTRRWWPSRGRRMAGIRVSTA